jgi:hypothetical protein
MSLVNTFITSEYTETIQKLIREIVNDPSTYMGSKYLPSVSLPVRKVRTDVVEATGGITQEHQPGTNPKYIQSFGSRVQEYEAPFYKEAIHYDEKKILFLRELGNNARNVRGVQQHIDLDIDRLNRRIEARIELERWNSIFNGGVTWMGKTVSFGIPAGNRVVPVGALWSLDGLTANAAANPLLDIRYWLQGGTSQYRKYKVRQMVMNPNTARWILDNANTRAFISSYGANPSIMAWDLNKVLSFVMPGGPEAVIYDGWYQNESVDSDGKISVSDAVYFIPDGYVFFDVSNLPGGDKIGEFQQTVHLASGTIDSPGFGKFLVVEDNTAPGSKGGPSNPYVDLLGGVYGGVNLQRHFDVLTAKVIA